MNQHTATHGDLAGLPSILGVLDGESWRRDAACATETDEMLFFNEPPNGRYRPHLESASLLLPMLICAGCPVREPCLATALHPAILPRLDDEWGVVEVFGVWGGTTEFDRYQVKDLPVPDAVEHLDRTLPDRLAERITAWRAHLAQHASSGSGRRGHKRDRRIEELLGGVGRFHLGGPGGPGRGHRGPIAEYVAAHHCSRDTAWRRLRRAS